MNHVPRQKLPGSATGALLLTALPAPVLAAALWVTGLPLLIDWLIAWGAISLTFLAAWSAGLAVNDGSGSRLAAAAVIVSLISWAALMMHAIPALAVLAVLKVVQFFQFRKYQVIEVLATSGKPAVMTSLIAHVAVIVWIMMELSVTAS